jgi:parallel beta-helix repeat protein
MKHLIGILVLSGLLLSMPIYGFAQNIALNKPVTVSSVESGTSYTGNLAVDGNTGTRWSSNHSDPQWIYVDLGSQYNITSVNITWENAYGKNYTIDVSTNASTWTTVKSVSNNTSLSNSNFFSVPATGRYVRIYGTARGTSYGYSIIELVVNGSLTSSGGTSSSNLALNKAATVSSVESGTSNTGNRAVDGSTSTRWSSNHSDPQWIYVDLGGTYNISNVNITWENAYGKNYNIDVSSNASTWTTVKSITNNTSKSNSNSVSGTGRYVRIYGTARGTVYGYSIYELVVNGSSGTSTPPTTPTDPTPPPTSPPTSGSGTGGITTATGKIYYFSSSTGDDSRSSTQAQSSSTPWRTLSKLNSYFSSLQPGDLVLFKRGDVFYGSINATKSGSSGAPIAFSAYGSGNKPVITGFATISSTSWTSRGNGAYDATISSGLSTLNSVTLDGSLAVMGKYPKGNTGYLTVSSGSTSSISSSGLSGIANFTGGEIVWRPYHWVLWRGTVISQSSSSVTFTSFASTLGGSVYPAKASYGFFFQNHPSACTSLGEWAYNAGSKKITMYFGSGPGSHVVNVSTIENLITLTSRSYLTFDNLALTGANTEAFSITNSNNIKINACDIFFSGHDAVNANSGCSAISITNNNINYSNFNAIVGGGSSGYTITGNTISNTATIAGMGGSGEGQYNAIMNVRSSNVSQNRITNTGYMPISFQGTNNLIQNNFIDTYCFVKDDGGGIYCGGQDFNGSRILGNIVLNGIGALTGTPDKDGRTHGIYVDDGGYNVEIGGNSVAYCQYGGIYTHNSHNLNIHDNTVFANGTTGIKYYNDGNSISNVTLTGNIFFAKTASQLVSYASGGSISPSAYFATANNNYWCRPLSESTSFQVYLNSALNNYSLSSWKSFTGKESSSKSSPITFTDPNRIRFEYNASSSSKTVNLGGNYIDARGTTYASSITLAPYTSAVLMNTSGSTTQSAATAEVIEQNDLTEKPSFTIYPNPVRDNFVLQLNNSHMGKMDVQIVNQAGSIIRSYLFNKDQIVNQITLPANDLATGVYFVHIQIGTWSDKRKIVKL